jgi:putative ABC transport system permease protein
MIRLALAGPRKHPGGYVGTFVAAFLAVALLAAGGLLLSSVLTAKPPADRFAAAPLVVSGARDVSVETVSTKHKKGKEKVKRKVKSKRLSGAGTLPADLAGRLAAVPGVARVVADAAFPVQVTGPDGRPLSGSDNAPVIGHGWASAALTPYTLRAGHQPGSGEAVIDADLAGRAGLSPGATLQVTTRTGVFPVRVSGIAAPAGRDGLPAQGALFVADSSLAQVSGLTGPTAIGIFPAAGTDLSALRTAIAPVAGDIDVVAGADRVRADLPGALPDYIAPISIFGFVIGITAFAAIFVLTGTVTLHVRQRLRELALLRTIGATPGQLRRLLGLESVVLAVLAALPGLPLGVVFARLIAARFKHLGAVPAQFAVKISVPVLLLAMLAGILVTFFSARISGRRAVRIAPTQALVETATTPMGALPLRIFLSLLTAAGAIGVLTFVPMDGPFGMGMSFISSALLLCSVAALGPVLVRAVLALVTRPFGLAGMLSRSGFRRVSAVTVPLVLMFAINAPMLLGSTLLDRISTHQQVQRDAAADAQASTPGGMPLSSAEKLAAVPGVTGAAALLPTRVILVRGGKPQHYAAQGLLTTGTQPALDLGVSAGAPTPDGLGISTWLAKEYGFQVGDEVTVWLADAEQAHLRVDMVYARNRGFGDLVLPAALVAAHDPRGLVRTVGLRYAAGTPDRIHADFPQLRLVATGSAAAAADASDQQGAWELLVVISLGFTAIAVVNTFAIATAARRREYADLRLAGATTRQLHRLALAEALLSVVTALLIGASVTGVVVGAFSNAQDGVLRVLVDPAEYLGLAGAIAALGLLAGVVPARLMLRRKALAVQV